MWSRQWKTSHVRCALHTIDLIQLAVIQLFPLMLQGRTQADVQSLIYGVLLQDIKNGFVWSGNLDHPMINPVEHVWGHKNFVLISTKFWCCSSYNLIIAKYRSSAWSSDCTIPQSVGTWFHYLMVAATGAPKVGLTTHQAFTFTPWSSRERFRTTSMYFLWGGADIPQTRIEGLILGINQRCRVCVTNHQG